MVQSHGGPRSYASGDPHELAIRYDGNSSGS